MILDELEWILGNYHIVPMSQVNITPGLKSGELIENGLIRPHHLAFLSCSLALQIRSADTFARFRFIDD